MSSCRTCLSEEANHYVFDNLDERDEAPLVAEAVMALASVQARQLIIELNDGLSAKICSNCLLELKEAYIFKSKCERADSILRVTKLKGNENICMKIEYVHSPETEENINLKQKNVVKEDVEISFCCPNKSDETPLKPVHTEKTEVDDNTHITKSELNCSKTDINSTNSANLFVPEVKLEIVKSTNDSSSPKKIESANVKKKRDSDGNLKSKRPTEKSYSCNMCNYRSISSLHLNEHIGTHTAILEMKRQSIILSIKKNRPAISDSDNTDDSEAGELNWETEFSQADSNKSLFDTSLPDCWTQKQLEIFQEKFVHLTVKNGKLGCSICAEVTNLGEHSEKHYRLSKQWMNNAVECNGNTRATRQASLRKKISEHFKSLSHLKALYIFEERAYEKKRNNI